MLFKMLKRIDELEEENEDLRKAMKDKDQYIASILQKCNEYKKENLAVAYVGFERIKQLAELGLDIRKEADVTPTSNN